MRTVLTMREADALLASRFPCVMESEDVALGDALGRVLAREVTASHNVPAFTRSMVDGYGVRASDTFGCSETIPALLKQIGHVSMGSGANLTLAPGTCAYVPTGGELPAGADAMVMIEHTEGFSGDLIAVEKPSAPGQHLIFPGDDVPAGAVALSQGCRLLAKDIGVLAALGVDRAPVRIKPKVAILSTGDELADAGSPIAAGQVYDVNGPMLAAQCIDAGADVVLRIRVQDDEAQLRAALCSASEAADMVLLSGGSSMGVRDLTAGLIEELGTVLFHGLAVKPGKPTLCGEIGGTPVVGLPGHPVAAYFICLLLVRPMLLRMLGTSERAVTMHAELASAIPSNHGREELVAVSLQNGLAVPIMGKSGLITTLARADGYVRIPGDTEGLMDGQVVTVHFWRTI